MNGRVSGLPETGISVVIGFSFALASPLASRLAGRFPPHSLVRQSDRSFDRFLEGDIP